DINFLLIQPPTNCPHKNNDTNCVDEGPQLGIAGNMHQYLPVKEIPESCTLFGSEQGGGFGQESAEGKNKKRVFAKYFKKADGKAFVIPYFDKPDHGSQSENRHPHGTNHVRAGPYFFINRKNQVPAIGRYQ